MKSIDIVQPQAMASVFAEDVFSSSGSVDFAIPDATSTSATDTCVMDDGFLPITSEPLPTPEEPDNTGIAPERKNFNGLFYLSTDQRVFLQNGGFVTFNANVSSAIGGYPQGAILGNIDSTGRFSFVKSLIDDNTYNFVATPSYIDGEHWEYASIKIDLSNADPSQSFIDMAISWGMPDYSRAVSFAPSNGQAVGFDGWLVVRGFVYSTGVDTTVSINGIVIGSAYANDAGAGGRNFSCIAMVKSSDILSYSNISASSVFYKVPFAGGNL